MKVKRSSFISTFILIASIFAGCSKASDTNVSENVKNWDSLMNQPITLKVTYNNLPMSDDDFELMLAGPMRNKYPNIKIELIKPATGTQIEDLVAAGNTPDLIAMWNGDVSKYKNLDLLTDISPLIKSHQVDLARFDPVTVNDVKENGMLYGLPFAINFNATYYNKTLFDKFGVSYPKDGMTWEDAIELAKKLSKTEGGVKYKGFDSDGVHRLGFVLSLEYINPKTNKASVNNDLFKKIFELYHEIYTIPGNERGSSFEGSQNLAMKATVNMLANLKTATEKGLNWDVAQYPSYKEKPNTYAYLDAHVMMISSTSKYKDQAMEAIKLLTSDDVQLPMTRKTARLSPLKNPEMKKQLGAELPFLQGKHLESIFKSKPNSPSPVLTPDYFEARAVIDAKIQDYMDGKIDVNTALRQADDEINQKIAAKQR